MLQILCYRYVALLGVLAAWVVPGQVAQASPPDGPRGDLVFVDEVALQIRRYHQEKDARKRSEWLGRLKPTRDPRVAVLLGEAMSDPDDDISCTAEVKVQHFFLKWPPSDSVEGRREEDEKVRAWWRENSARLRRQAKLLPH